jgi:hemerythrin-like metal-binding protein
MRTLKWSISHEVFVREIDDEHKEIFEALAAFQKLSNGGGEASEVRKATERLVTRMTDHFAHEERLMRAARYEAEKWHRKMHLAAKWRVEAFADRLMEGHAEAAGELVEYLTEWLSNHTRVADRMMGAALRNHDRHMWKLTFEAGTKPLGKGKWVTVTGEPFERPEPNRTM